MRLRSSAPRERSGSTDDIDAVFRKIERLTATGATIGALELLARRRTLDDRSLLGWPVSRTRVLSLNRRPGRYLDKVLRYPQVLGMVGVRAVGGMALLSPRTGRGARAAALAGMTATGAGLNLRSNYGLDGSDHLTFINFAVALLEKLYPNDRKAREAALAFVAAQSCLSYFTSGTVKMTSPVWRSGDAITGVFRTRTYGDRFFYRLVKDRKLAAQALAWGVMVAEALFPLVLVAPRPLARMILLSGMVFHVCNARFMGLNRFFWSFVATYPAVAHFSRHLGGADGRKGRAVTAGEAA